MNQGYTFEVCAVNIQSALTAQAAGAHRIELCSALDTGGVTPSPGLINAVVEALNIPVNVLIRPREGDFCYDNRALDIMLADIRYCLAAGAHGVVVGALDTSGGLDMPKLEAMRDAAGGMEMVLHRAFDFCNSPAEALEQVIDLGFGRILSSGQSTSAFEGRFKLQEMVALANGRISIMPGAGIDVSNIHAITTITGAKEFHFTAKKKVDSRKKNAIPGLETGYWESDAALIRKIMAAA